MRLSEEKIKELYNEYKTTNKSLTKIAEENNTSRQNLVAKFKKYCNYTQATLKPKKNK